MRHKKTSPKNSEMFRLFFFKHAPCIASSKKNLYVGCSYPFSDCKDTTYMCIFTAPLSISTLAEYMKQCILN